MKQTAFIALLLTLALTACDKKKLSTEPFIPAPATSSATMPAAALPSTQPSMNAAAPAMAPTSAATRALTQKATVVSTIDVSEFTYIEATQDGNNRWLAAKTILAKKGDIIQFDDGATMANFNSKALNRTFPSITFVNRVSIDGGK